MLYKIRSDPEHPFSEAVGMLQRIDQGEGDAAYHLVRRSGETLVVAKSDIVSLKRL